MRIWGVHMRSTLAFLINLHKAPAIWNPHSKAWVGMEVGNTRRQWWVVIPRVGQQGWLCWDPGLCSCCGGGSVQVAFYMVCKCGIAASRCEVAGCSLRCAWIHLEGLWGSWPWLQYFRQEVQLCQRSLPELWLEPFSATFPIVCF